ncbi:MAG: TolC family protein [Bacteroidota bacterium]
MKPLFLFALLACLSAPTWAQNPGQIELSESYRLAEQNYPLTRQRELISKTAEFSVQNLQKGYLPQIFINAQGSYQSEVTQLPIKLPGAEIEPLSKDQYKIFADVSQVLYDGGTIRQQKELQQANAAVEQQKLEVSLYQLKDRVNQLFFGILLIDKQIRQHELLSSDLELGLKKVQALIANGTALKSNGDVLMADLLKNKQHLIELKAARKAYTHMLGLFIGREISENTVIVQPPSLNVMSATNPASQTNSTFQTNPSIVFQKNSTAQTNSTSLINSISQINRVELQLYRQQGKYLDAQDKLLTTKTLPKLSLFAQGGYGRPALNMLSNNFKGYYIGGLRLTWSPSVLYTLKQERQLININRNTIDLQKETFLFNTNLTLVQQNTELSKYQELLGTDAEIVQLRARIKTASLAQLDNGVINSNDYLREVNAENQARLSESMHQVQLLMAQYNQHITTGN